MNEALAQIGKVKSLAASGKFASVLDLLDEESPDGMRRSATLALLYGISKARLGDFASGKEWAGVALERARATADAPVEARALNVLGAVAFENGRIDEAERYFSQGLDAAKQIEDPMTMGRAANNLGVIANLRGDHPRAVASFTRALTSFEQAGSQRGVAETLNNMGISYRDHGDYHEALDHADRAVQAAESVGDPILTGQTWAGVAEVRVRAGDARLARRDAEAALALHREADHAIGQTEDLRILALTLIGTGDQEGAERMLRDVIGEAEHYGRPLLAANAGRDLAQLLAEQGRWDETRDVARTARAQFNQLGAVAEVKALDGLLARRPAA